MTFKTYGVTAAVDVGPAALVHEELERNGFTVLADVISPDKLTLMRDALDRLVASQTARIGGEAVLAEIGEVGQARALLEEEPVFLELLRLPTLDALVEGILGPAAIVMQQNGIIMPPLAAEHHQQSWHRDLPYQEWVSTKPIALGALAVLDDFSAESGGTRFLLGSHRHARFPGNEFVERWAFQASAKAGSVIVFDAMVFHAGGLNRKAFPRRAVNTLFGIPLLAQQIRLTSRDQMDPKLRRRLGLDYQSSATTDAWRAARLARIRGAKA